MPRVQKKGSFKSGLQPIGGKGGSLGGGLQPIGGGKSPGTMRPGLRRGPGAGPGMRRGPGAMSPGLRKAPARKRAR